MAGVALKLLRILGIDLHLLLIDLLLIASLLPASAVPLPWVLGGQSTLTGSS